MMNLYSIKLSNQFLKNRKMELKLFETTRPPPGYINFVTTEFEEKVNQNKMYKF